MSANVLCEAPADKVRVARFLRPDLRPVLYDGEPIDQCGLYKELHAGAITPLPKGGVLVLNFGLVDWFPTAFYRLLLKALEDVRSKGGRVLLCGMTANVQEGLDLLRSSKQFEMHSTEERALAEAKK